MKQALAVSVAVVLCLLLEARGLFGLRLDATTVLACYIGLRYGTKAGLFLGAALGVASDVVAGGLIGPGALSRGIVGYLSSLMPNVLFNWSRTVGFFSAGLLTLVERVVSFAVISLIEEMPSGPGRAALTALGAAAINSVAGFFLLKPRRGQTL